MKKKGFVFLGAVIFMAVTVFSLTGCGSAPAPVGDPGSARDALAGKSFKFTMMGIRPNWVTFNYDGTVISKSVVMGFIPVSNMGTYTVSGKTGTCVIDKSYPMSLNSATDPTEIVLQGYTWKKVQ